MNWSKKSRLQKNLDRIINTRNCMTGIVKLTSQQRLELIEHMEQFDNDSYDIHGLWAWNNFDVFVTAEECRGLFDGWCSVKYHKDEIIKSPT